MNFDFKHIKKKLALIGMLGFTCTALTGCGDDLRTFATGDLTNKLDNRFDRNIQIVEDLYEVSLISAQDRENWIKHIKGVKDSTLQDRKVTYMKDTDGDNVGDTETTETIRCTDLSFDDNGKVGGTMYRSFSYIKVYETVDNLLNSCGISSGTDSYTKYSKIINDQGGIGLYSLGDYLNSDKALNLGNGAGVHATNIGDEAVIHIIEEGTAFDQGLDFDIRVLKPNIKPEELDIVIGLLQDSANIDYNKLDGYFQSATDTSGEAIKFSDLIELNQDNIITKSRDNSSGDKTNEPGLDLAVYQPLGTDKEFFAGSIKFYEFNQKEINKILNFMGIDSTTGINTDKWLIRKRAETGNNVMYLMEYPVYYVEGFQDYTKADGNLDKNKVEASVAKSDLSVNIKTKSIIYTNNGASSVITSTGDPYLTFGDSLNSTGASGLSSFVVCGLAKVNMNDGMDVANNKEAVVPRVILRDYLELTYAPNFETDDSGTELVVLGRKLRLVNFSREDAGSFDGSSGITTRALPGDIITKIDSIKSEDEKDEDITDTPSNSGSGEDIRNTSVYRGILGFKQLIPLSAGNQQKLVFDKGLDVAQFVSASGEIITSSPGIKITELASIKYINSDDTIVRLADNVETLSAKHPRNKNETETVDGLYHSVTDGFIDTTTAFPGTVVGQADNTQDKNKMKNNAWAEDTQIHQQFYAMFVATNLFDNGLFSSWLNSPDENASLNWWITYLNDNGYVYELSTSAVEKYLYDNFVYELQQNGIVMLDLEVVHKIQEDLDEEAHADTVTFIRTVFTTLGWALVIYACILFLCWQLDTNADLGLRLTNTLTLGNWEPIKDINECPYMDTSGVKYVDMKRLGVSCMIIITAGIFLIIFNVYDIVLLLIRALGVLAQEINEMLTGIV